MVPSDFLDKIRDSLKRESEEVKKIYLEMLKYLTPIERWSGTLEKYAEQDEVKAIIGNLKNLKPYFIRLIKLQLLF